MVMIDENDLFRKELDLQYFISLVDQPRRLSRVNLLNYPLETAS